MGRMVQELLVQERHRRGHFRPTPGPEERHKDWAAERQVASEQEHHKDSPVDSQVEDIPWELQQEHHRG